uniref:Uncharacterized protein n=1 Tax=Myoviridae sp. ctYA416 TaxID=2825125 RepID=A0A8S5UTB6_9CAUD|nr:MAG TPA: hypothetical protein [Myoviridae sp. ctYA416]
MLIILLIHPYLFYLYFYIGGYNKWKWVFLIL